MYAFSTDGYYEDAEEVELTQQGQATLDRLEEMFMARGDNPHIHPNGQIQLEAPGPGERCEKCGCEKCGCEKCDLDVRNVMWMLGM